jgi:pimeloyl-ACP methyl ester carboxylesterase
MTLSPAPRFVDNGPARLAYTVHSPDVARCPPVCLIASTGRGPGDFGHLADALVVRGVPVILPWPRGMAPSTGPLATVDFHDLAADVAAILRAEAPGGAIVAGHAYGCWIARTLAQDHPDLTRALVLIAAGAGSWPPDLSRAIEIAMDPAQPESARLAALQRAFFAPGHDPRPWLDGWNADLVNAQRAARARTIQASWWDSGTAPVLDILALQDPFRPADSRAFYADAFPGRVTVRPVDGASHALPDERPDQVAAILADWIATLDPGA